MISIGDAWRMFTYPVGNLTDPTLEKKTDPAVQTTDLGSKLTMLPSIWQKWDILTMASDPGVVDSDPTLKGGKYAS